MEKRSQLDRVEKNPATGNIVPNGKNTHEEDVSPEKTKQTDSNAEFLNYGEEDEMEIQGYKKSYGKTLITWAFVGLTLGALRLVFHWWPRLMLYASHNKCAIRNADKILVMENYQQKYKRYYVKPIYTISAHMLKSMLCYEEKLCRDVRIFSRARNVFSQSVVDGASKSNANFDERLQQELKAVGAPKLVIPDSKGMVHEVEKVRAFNCKKLRYIWDDDLQVFSKLKGYEDCPTNVLHENVGLSVFQQCQRRLTYGNNEIKVEVQSVVKLLFLEVLNPFYIFQIFSVCLWMVDKYVYYATAIIIMSAFGIITTIIQTRSNQKKLQTTVRSSDIITVCRGSDVYESVPTEHLVPGDLIVIPPHGVIMNCDAALLSGNCIVNESMLTGESVPVTKIPLPNRSDVIYNMKEHARNTLFSGTQIIQTRYYGTERVMAVVLRTGFLTAKGNLVRSIMYPPPVDYKFENDSYKFVGVLACIAGIGFINSVLTKLAHGESVKNIVIRSLDLITIVVPPALPAAMTVGRMYAQRRLQQLGIYCISPRAINVSGSINCVCFDKTGTLTEEGLDLWGVVPIETSANNNIEQEPSETSAFIDSVRRTEHLQQGPLMVGMAACHSLTIIDGNLIGDPLDLKMFEWTDWSLEEPGVADNEKFDMVTPTVVRQKMTDGLQVGIVRQFPFSSSLQRMSVITRTLGGSEFELFVKGSPEMISSLALPNSIPENFSEELEKYTQQGYRVIALGHRMLPKMNYAKVQRAVREEVETELTLLGLVIMENRLKEETTGVMRVLKNADVRTVMVTGDNMLTAISVARECGMLEANDKVLVVGAETVGNDKVPRLTFTPTNKMVTMQIDTQNGGIPQEILNINPEKNSHEKGRSLANMESPTNRYHFALTGNVFSIIRTYYSELMPKLVVRGTVFARMSPDQKQQLVQYLQGLGYFVAMCGDGANDCGALKAAHAGISLSEAESSVASPFTSKNPNITCVPHLIKEGRSALVTSFGIFKYMAVYSLTQFSTVIILYTISANLGDLQFLYIDLLLISVFALFFGRTEPYAGPLERIPPSASLVSLAPVVSIMLHMLTVLGFQILAFVYVQQQSWFKPFRPDPENEEKYNGPENYSLFAVSAFQYIIMAVIFSRGKPYRKSLVTNPGLLTSLVIMTAVTIFLVLFPFKWSEDTLQIQIPADEYFALTLLGFAVCNFIISLAIEQVIINYFLETKLDTFRRRKGPKSGKEYALIDYDLGQMSDWPPISTSYGVSASIQNEAVTQKDSTAKNR